MKNVFFLAVIFLGIVLLMMSADFRRIPGLGDQLPDKKQCTGYTIIEYDKGVDCNGDTIRLARRNGYAERY